MNKPTVYFYCCPQGPAENSNYQHDIVALAEGLYDLNIPFYSNINYWKLTPLSDKYLFSHSPDVQPDHCDIVVLSSGWFINGYAMPPQLFHRNRKYMTVFIDIADGVYTDGFRSEFRQFDLVLRGHCNHHAVGYPSNMKPWLFGPTKRIIDANSWWSALGRPKADPTL